MYMYMYSSYDEQYNRTGESSHRYMYILNLVTLLYLYMVETLKN